MTDRTAPSASRRRGAASADAHALAGALRELAERYAWLERHAMDPPGRTPERRDGMRRLSSRHPGALRELDAIGVDGVRRRAEAVRAALARAEAGEPVDLAADLAFARCAIALVPRLRDVLAIKRRIATAGVDVRAPAGRATLRAWYHRRTGRDLPDARIDEIASPPGGQVQQLAYRDAARELGLTVDRLKAILYPRAGERAERSTP
ncbi:MAG: hypothetical protein D6689_15655 [Deltaproteobacteria bacterium]|nr:MAG: hypothetical protein D6689_15655 [Deltaproteobacteria bacterium]